MQSSKANAEHELCVTVRGSANCGGDEAVRRSSPSDVPQLSEVQPANTAAHIGAASDELLAAWERDPRCAECAATILSAEDAAFLVAAERVVHRVRCFVPALLRRHPSLRLLAAHPGAKEVIDEPFHRDGRDGEGPNRRWRAQRGPASHG